jgi:hypothetical protein
MRTFSSEMTSGLREKKCFKLMAIALNQLARFAGRSAA